MPAFTTFHRLRVQKFRDLLKDKNVPEHAEKLINEEINRLEFLDPNSSEFQVARNYLDWLTVLPWGVQTEDNLDLENAWKIFSCCD